ncbi:serine/threonine-protein kinase WNK2-like [Zingiber officinale]|uniref:serine/threonine-protein kinase WNK2-like n=1 Tax=Zingiber officinale TaxID=94328 RepID=UPI001C4AC8FD|nr:serine/threonine-protein kinase WNK2-like [Zingiber officinale]
MLQGTKKKDEKKNAEVELPNPATLGRRTGGQGDGDRNRGAEERRRRGGGWSLLWESGLAATAAVVAAPLPLTAAAGAGGPVANDSEAQDEAHHQKHSHYQEEDLGGLPHPTPLLPPAPSTPSPCFALPKPATPHKITVICPKIFPPQQLQPLSLLCFALKPFLPKPSATPATRDAPYISAISATPTAISATPTARNTPYICAISATPATISATPVAPASPPFVDSSRLLLNGIIK